MSIVSRHTTKTVIFSFYLVILLQNTSAFWWFWRCNYKIWLFLFPCSLISLHILSYLFSNPYLIRLSVIVVSMVFQPFLRQHLDLVDLRNHLPQCFRILLPVIQQEDKLVHT